MISRIGFVWTRLSFALYSHRSRPIQHSSRSLHLNFHTSPVRHVVEFNRPQKTQPRERLHAIAQSRRMRSSVSTLKPQLSSPMYCSSALVRSYLCEHMLADHCERRVRYPWHSLSSSALTCVREHPLGILWSFLNLLLKLACIRFQRFEQAAQSAAHLDLVPLQNAERRHIFASCWKRSAKVWNEIDDIDTGRALVCF